MTNVQQGMSKEEVGGRLYAKLLPWTFLVRYWTFFSLRATVVWKFWDRLLASHKIHNGA